MTDGTPDRRGPLDRLLSLGADVRAGEGTGALMLAGNVFLLLAFYYLLKTGFTGSHCLFYSWSTGSPAEKPGAGGNRDQDLALDPNGCGIP